MRSVVRKEALPRPRGMTAVVVVVLLVSIVTNLLLAFVLLQHLSARQPEGQVSPTPRCTAIPVKLILEDPECADKLLRAMNVTNVRVVARNSS
jgi:hypothetical protein